MIKLSLALSYEGQYLYECFMYEITNFTYNIPESKPLNKIKCVLYRFIFSMIHILKYGIDIFIISFLFSLI